MRYAAALIPDILIEAIARLVGYVVRLLRPGSEMSAESKVRGALLGPRFGAKRLTVGRGCLFEGWRNITIGNDVRLRPGVHLVAGRNGSVKLADGVHISRNSIFAGGGGIEVGLDTGFSSGVVIYSVHKKPQGDGPDHKAPIVPAAVRFGRDIRVGANTTFLPGVTINDRSVVGAGAVVIKDVPPDTTVAGVPAKPLGR